ncbi:MAG: DUF3999 domain-containing protein [Pseudomonadota bacterium]
MNLRIALLLLLLLPLGLSAQHRVDHPLAPRDFAYGLPLEVDGDGALYRLELPAVVYRHTARRDLGDMRVFNGYNEVVPHLLQTTAQPQTVVDTSEPLPYFPLYGVEREGDTQVHIATDSEGAVVDFWQRGVEPLEQLPVERYLVDLTALEHPLSRLLLSWDESSEPLLFPVQVEYSNDLGSWQRLSGSHTLAALDHQGQRLLQRAIVLPALQANYLRLSWPPGEKGIALREVRAEVQRGAGERSRQWLTLSPEAEEAPPHVYTFRAGGHFPVDRVQVSLPQANTVVQARLYSRPVPEVGWRLRHSGPLYRLEREGYTLRNDAIAVGEVSDGYWRLEIEPEGGGLGRGQPQLGLGWVPHQLYFVARGEAPFSLAFGAARVAPFQEELVPLMQSIRQKREGEGFIKTARAGSFHELGGQRRLEPKPPPLPWERWLLWGVLLVGVAVLALMVRSLMRQMGSDGRTN